MTFEAYLHGKKIDSNAFHAADPERWTSWAAEFDQMSAASFTAQKLYLINPVRRQFPLPAEPPPPGGTDKPEAARPVIRPRFR